MKLWITNTQSPNGSSTYLKRAHGSEKEARAGVGPDANGEASFVDIDSDKTGIIAIFNGDYKINATEKKFDIKNGKWHTRVG